MKINNKILTTAMSALTALCAYAADIDVNANMNIEGEAENLNFTTSGVAAALTGPLTLCGNITVDEGVNATLTSSTSSSSTAYLITSDESSTFSGAGKFAEKYC